MYLGGGGEGGGAGQNPLGKNRKQPTANGERKPIYVLGWVIQIKSSHDPYANHSPLFALEHSLEPSLRLYPRISDNIWKP